MDMQKEAVKKEKIALIRDISDLLDELNGISGKNSKYIPEIKAKSVNIANTLVNYRKSIGKNEFLHDSDYRQYNAILLDVISLYDAINNRKPVEPAAPAEQAKPRISFSSYEDQGDQDNGNQGLRKRIDQAERDVFAQYDSNAEPAVQDENRINPAAIKAEAPRYGDLFTARKTLIHVLSRIADIKYQKEIDEAEKDEWRVIEPKDW